MIVWTTWKARPLSPEQATRMMDVWSRTEAKVAPAGERLAWYLAVDGSGGVSIDRFDDPDAAAVHGLEIALALGEFLEIESKVVLDLDAAMPAITAAAEYLP